jgi:hypothetical protein
MATVVTNTNHSNPTLVSQTSAPNTHQLLFQDNMMPIVE